MIVDRAVYVDGRRQTPGTAEDPVAGTREVCRESGGFAWIGLYEPTEEEFASVRREFGVDEMLAWDAGKAHQRPKLTHYGETLFVVLKPARYLDASEAVEFGEIHLLQGPDFIVTVRHGAPSALHELRERVESDPDLLRQGPSAVLYAVVDRVVYGYTPVLEGLENDIDEIESEVFSGESDVSRRIYELSREVIQFHRAVRPLPEALARIGDEAEGLDPEMKGRLRAARDHALRVTEQVEEFRQLLSNILEVNLTMVGVQQNRQVQKISAWAAILIVPTIVSGIYGMNFNYMPELSWVLGYPYALALIVVISVALYAGFKRSGWL